MTSKQSSKKIAVFMTIILLLCIPIIFIDMEQIYAETIIKVNERVPSEGLIAVGKVSITCEGEWEFSEDGEYEYEYIKGSYGYWDEKGKRVIDPQFDGADSFSNGLAAVEKDNKFGLIDKNGNIVIDFQYDGLVNSDGFIRVKKGQKWGLIDSSGNELAECRYKDIRVESDKFAIASTYRGKVVLNKKGEIISDYYDWIGGFSEGRAQVEKNRKYGYIDESGKLVIKCKYSNAYNFEGQVAVVCNEEYKDGLVNKQGKEILKCGYEIEIQNGYVIYGKNHIYGLYSDKGKEILPRKYRYIEVLSDGTICAANKNGQQAIFTNKGKQLTKLEYTQINDFSDGLARIENTDYSTYKTEYSFIDKKGNEVLKLKGYSYVDDFVNGLAIVYKDDRYGVIDKNGKEVVNCQYYRISLHLDNLIAVENRKKYGFLDRNGEEIFNCQFDNYYLFENSLIAVNKDGKWGFLDKNGKVVIKCKYQDVDIRRFASKHLVLVKKNNKYGFINSKGKEVVKCQYDKIVWHFNDLVLLKKGNKFSVFDIEDGKFVKTKKADFFLDFGFCEE